MTLVNRDFLQKKNLSQGKFLNALASHIGDFYTPGQLPDDLLVPSRNKNILEGMQEHNRITGSTKSNILKGGRGRDHLNGAGGSDILKGGRGRDRLNGAGGSDILKGGRGHDTYRVDVARDRIIERKDNGVDTVIALIDWTLAKNLEHLDLRGQKALAGVGNRLNNRIKGNSQNNSLQGGNGNDELKGRKGHDKLQGAVHAAQSMGDIDTLIGGSGADTFILGNGTGSFYDDGDSTTQGNGDYALIKRFDISADFLQIFGQWSEYIFMDSPRELPPGIAIYLDKPDGEPDELIAILQGVSLLDLSKRYQPAPEPTTPVVISPNPNPVNTPPVTNNDTYSTRQNLPLVITSPMGLLRNDSDADGDILTIDTFAPISSEGGSIHVNPDGSFIYTPPTNFFGTDGFAYTVTDNNGNTASATVTLSVLSTIQIEAEDMALTEYEIETEQTFSSNDALIAVTPIEGTIGTATTSFKGVTGNYDIVVGYFDELDGESQLSVFVNDALVSTWTLNNSAGGTRANATNFVERIIATNFTLSTNDEIRIEGTTERGERSRVDFIRFEHTGKSTPANANPIVRDDIYSSSENTTLTLTAPSVFNNDSDMDDDSLTITAFDSTSNPGGTVLLNADDSSDVITGTTPNLAGAHEQDQWMGSTGEDYFILGDTTQACYVTMGNSDYVIIQNFNANEDIVQMHGVMNDYIQEQQGNDVHLKLTGTNKLIAIFTNISTLNLASDGFNLI